MKNKILEYIEGSKLIREYIKEKDPLIKKDLKDKLNKMGIKLVKPF